MDTQIALEFYPDNIQKFKDELKQHFPELAIIQSSGFSGTEIVSIIVPSAVLLVGKLLDFYNQRKDNLKKATLKVGKDSVELSGFTPQEIASFIDSGDINNLLEQLKNEKGTR